LYGNPDPLFFVITTSSEAQFSVLYARIPLSSPSYSGAAQAYVHWKMRLGPDISLFLFPVLGSDPHFHVEVTKSREILLECKSEGWFPLPKIQWINSWGEQIPSVSESQTQNKGGLFHVSASLLLKDPSPKNMTCSVWNPVLNQKKEEQISIAGQFSLPLY
jgi:hypothetical protein